VSMQDQYSLLQREEEREMHPYCLDTGIGVIPWSPLARGRLTRDWDEATARSETDQFGRTLYGQEGDRRIVDAVRRVAEARGVSRAQVALAWVLAQPAVTAPIIGATKPHHLDDAIAAAELELTEDELDALEADYVPHAPSGF
jgi:aryl-alcohol dehydrogenase-like predicted oxidoreductase